MSGPSVEQIAAAREWVARQEQLYNLATGVPIVGELACLLARREDRSREELGALWDSIVSMAQRASNPNDVALELRRELGQRGHDMLGMSLAYQIAGKDLDK